VAFELPQVEAQASVIQDDGHRQGHQRLEGGPEQSLRIDVGSERTRDETDGQQHDDRGDAQLARQYLGADREDENQAYASQDLVGRHAALRGWGQAPLVERSAAMAGGRHSPSTQVTGR
jgi:hypothetical protein